MSTRKLSDSSGTVTDNYVYDAFGNIIDMIGATTNNYLYTNQQYDPNVGFYYLRSRYYNPQAGRFITHDPLLGNVFDPISLHRYSYADADPVNNSDPSGMWTLTNLQVALGVISILSAISVQNFVETKYQSAALGIFAGAVAGAFVFAFVLGICSGLLASVSTPAAVITENQIGQDFSTIKQAIAAGRVGEIIGVGQNFVKTPIGRLSVQKTYDYAWAQAAAQGTLTPKMREIINALEQMLGRP